MEKNISTFNSPLHRRLWLLSMASIPIEVSTAWIKSEPLLESCRQFYDYANDAYDDILEFPDENYVDLFDPAFEDIFHIDSAIIGNIKFHTSMLEIFLKAACDTTDDHIEIENAEYDKLIKITRSKYNGHVKNCGLNLPYTYNDLLTNLSRRGIAITHTESLTIITNSRYPRMFLAANCLYNAAKAFNSKTGRSSQWFCNLDFRAIENPYRKTDLDDIFYPLSPEEKTMADDLYNCAGHKKFQYKYVNLSGIRDASFLYDKNHIFSFLWRDRYGFRIKVKIPEPGTAEHELLSQKINELENADVIKDFCLDNLFGCLFCNKKCMQNNAYKKKWVIFGRPAPKLIASCWGFSIFFPPDRHNISMTKTLIDLLTEIHSDGKP